MNKGRMSSRIIFIISGLAFYGLLMPASAVGVLAIPVLAVVFWYMYTVVSDVKADGTIQMVAKAAISVIIFVILGKGFCEQWQLSGIVNSVASLLHLNAYTLSALVAIGLAIVAFPFIWKIVSAVNGKSASILVQQDDGMWKFSVLDILFAMVISFSIAMQFSLNPFSEVFPGSDASVFLYIGQEMANGKTPYVDLFDHKGIVLYLIQWLGMTVLPWRFMGVWLLEVLNLFVSAVIIMKISALFSKKKEVAYCCVMITLGILNGFFAYEGGNLTEEYALPGLLLATFIFLKYFITEKYTFVDIMLLGISFIVVFFLRANMITVWVAYMPVVFFGLLFKKKWKDLGRCIAGFVTGCGVALLPLLVYIFANGCFDKMCQYYFEFNFGYSDSEGSIVAILKTVIFLFSISGVFTAIQLLTTIKYYKNKIYCLNLWFLAVSLGLASMSGRMYYHYGVVLLPTLLVPLLLVLSSLWESQTGRNVKKQILCVIVVFLVAQVIYSAVGYQGVEKAEITTYIEEHTDDEDKILVIGNDCRYYLESGRGCDTKYFYQTPPVNVSDEIYKEFMKELDGYKPDMIVVIGNRENLLADGNNLTQICEKLDEWCETERYSLEEADSYYVLQKNK